MLAKLFRCTACQGNYYALEFNLYNAVHSTFDNSLHIGQCEFRLDLNLRSLLCDLLSLRRIRSNALTIGSILTSYHWQYLPRTLLPAPLNKFYMVLETRLVVRERVEVAN